MVIAQGDVLWASLPEPAGSGPGFRRPVIVVQGDALNRSRIATAICIPLTSNLRLGDAPGNVVLKSRSIGLAKDSVANVSQIVSIDRALLGPRTGHVSKHQIDLVFAGIDLVLGRP
jgi:mRNA interferase MazF